MTSSPAQRDYQVGLLLDRIAAVEDRCARLERAPRIYVERAQVTAYGGGTMCVVTYPSGTTRALLFSADCTPTPGTHVLVLDSPYWAGVICEVTA